MVLRMYPVESENLAAVGYDPHTRELVIKFKSGPTYSYFDVDPAMYAQLLNAASIGDFFSTNLRSWPQLKRTG